MTDITFSVIIPCYNDGARIERAVNSCLSQSYTPFEVIVVDDGSREDTRSVIRALPQRLGSNVVKVILLEKNSGVSVARNTGMTAAQGDYLSFLDSDEVWHPKKLERAKLLIDKLGRIAQGHDFTYDLKDLDMPLDTVPVHYRKISLTSILFRNIMTTSTWAIPNRLGIKFREDQRHTEDHEFLVRLVKICPLYFLDEKLVHLDRPMGSKGGLSGNTFKMRLGELRMYVLLCRADWRFYPLLPFLILYSLAKHVRKVILRAVR